MDTLSKAFISLSFTRGVERDMGVDSVMEVCQTIPPKINYFHLLVERHGFECFCGLGHRYLQ